MRAPLGLAPPLAMPAASDITHSLRVYWEDTDAGGVVFYANYLKYFERARSEWMRERGFGQETLLREFGAMFVVVHTNVRYLRPARLDDVLHITAEIVEIAGASMSFLQVAWRGEERLVEGGIRIGCVDSTSLKPRRIPKELAVHRPSRTQA